jgi:four helix bundle protein
MGVFRFEDLRVWQAAHEQSNRVGALLKRPEFKSDRKLGDQLNDAALSVPLNISEGFLRRGNKEMRQFLRYAFASNGEVKAAYYAAHGRKMVTDAELHDLIDLNERIAKMLRRFIATLNGP